MRLILFSMFIFSFIACNDTASNKVSKDPTQRVLGQYKYSDKGMAEVTKINENEVIINLAYDPSGRNVKFQVTAKLEGNELIGKWKGITTPSAESAFHGQISPDFSSINFAKSNAGKSGFNKVILIKI